jgi:hypothetical protein
MTRAAIVCLALAACGGSSGTPPADGGPEPDASALPDGQPSLDAGASDADIGPGWACPDVTPMPGPALDTTLGGTGVIERPNLIWIMPGASCGFWVMGTMHRLEHRLDDGSVDPAFEPSSLAPDDTSQLDLGGAYEAADQTLVLVGVAGAASRRVSVLRIATDGHWLGPITPVPDLLFAETVRAPAPSASGVGLAVTARPPQSHALESFVRIGFDGSLDTAFGQEVLDTASQSLVVPDPRGGWYQAHRFPLNTTTVTRYGADGKVDLSYGTSGRAQAGTPGLVLQRLLVAQDGSLYIVGWTSAYASGAHHLICALTPDGAMRADYGNIAIPCLARSPAGQDINGKAALDAQGRVYVLDEYADPRPRVRRYTATGAYDTTFGPEGRYTVPVDQAFNHPQDLFVDRAGRLVLVGHAYTSASGLPVHAWLARVWP